MFAVSYPDVLGHSGTHIYYVIEWNWRVLAVAEDPVRKYFWNLDYLDWLQMHFSAWSKVFFAKLVLNNIGSIFGHPYQLNGTRICLGMTLIWNYIKSSKFKTKLFYEINHSCIYSVCSWNNQLAFSFVAIIIW